MKKLCFQHRFVHVAKNATKCMSFWYIFALVTATFWWLKGFVGKWAAECQNKKVDASHESCVGCRTFQALRRRVPSKRSNFWPHAVEVCLTPQDLQGWVFWSARMLLTFLIISIWNVGSFGEASGRILRAASKHAQRPRDLLVRGSSWLTALLEGNI